MSQIFADSAMSGYRRENDAENKDATQHDDIKHRIAGHTIQTWWKIILQEITQTQHIAGRQNESHHCDQKALHDVWTTHEGRGGSHQCHGVDQESI